MIDFWFPRWLKTILRKYPNNRKIADVDMEEIRKNLKKFMEIQALSQYLTGFREIMDMQIF